MIRALLGSLVYLGSILPASVAGQDQPRLVVLSIGLGNYADDDMDFEIVEDANSDRALPSDGARWFGETIGAAAGVCPIILTDNEATTGRVRRELIDQVSRLPPRSTVLLYFGGHGHRVRHGTSGTSDLYLLLFGSTQQEPLGDAIMLHELLLMFKRAPGINAMIFLDCCYAGQDAQTRFGHAADFNELGSRVVLYAASSEYERAHSGQFVSALKRVWAQSSDQCEMPPQLERLIQDELADATTRCHLYLGEQTEICLRNPADAAGLKLLCIEFDGDLNQHLTLLRKNKQTGGFEEVNEITRASSSRRTGYVRQIQNQPAEYQLVPTLDYRHSKKYSDVAELQITAAMLEDKIVVWNPRLKKFIVSRSDRPEIERLEFRLASSIEHGMPQQVVDDITIQVAQARFDADPFDGMDDLFELHENDLIQTTSFKIAKIDRDGPAMLVEGLVPGDALPTFEVLRAKRLTASQYATLFESQIASLSNDQVLDTFASDSFKQTMIQVQALGGHQLVYGYAKGLESKLVNPHARAEVLSIGALSAALVGETGVAEEWSEDVIRESTVQDPVYRMALFTKGLSMQYHEGGDTEDTETERIKDFWSAHFPGVSEYGVSVDGDD